MFHGGGVSASIFTIQTRKVLWKLRPYFEFVFLDAPWVSPPGPGVLPVFADAGPFYRWARLHENEDANKLSEKLRAVLSKPGGEWVGVLGFSQGGRLAAGLCWQQQHGAGGLDGLAPGLRFKFAALVGAAWPLLFSVQEAPTMAGQRESSLWDEGFEGSIGMPSVHCIGRRDAVAEMARLIAKCFDKEQAKMLEPNIGHQMPLEEKENNELCDAILEAYKRGGGVLEEFPA